MCSLLSIPLFCSVAQLCPTLQLVDCSMPGFPVLHHLPEFAQIHIESVMPCNHFILCCPLLPSFFSSIRWPKYWSFSISSSNEYSGLISFRIAWFDHAVQGTLKSLLQHYSWKASIFQRPVFIVQLSGLYMTTGKTIAF